MIIVDLNQTMISNLMIQIGNHKNAEIEPSMVRHMVLNSIRYYKQKFGRDYGELVIASDSTNYWRKRLFPYYKAGRKKNIEASELDWPLIFNCMNMIRNELRDFFPYRVINVDTAEADDIIGTLVHEFGVDFGPLKGGPPILILSGDKDFIQLHRYSNVKQYDPVRKKWLQHPDPEQFVREHIISGDRGDGIPNILSPDNCFVIGQRQNKMTTKRMEYYLSVDPERYGAVILRNYHRNRELIDLKYIPNDICEKVMEQYNQQENKKTPELINYFIEHQLINLIDHLAEF